MKGSLELLRIRGAVLEVGSDGAGVAAVVKLSRSDAVLSESAHCGACGEPLADVTIAVSRNEARSIAPFIMDNLELKLEQPLSALPTQSRLSAALMNFRACGFELRDAWEAALKDEGFHLHPLFTTRPPPVGRSVDEMARMFGAWTDALVDANGVAYHPQPGSNESHSWGKTQVFPPLARSQTEDGFRNLLTECLNDPLQTLTASSVTRSGETTAFTLEFMRLRMAPERKEDPATIARKPVDDWRDDGKAGQVLVIQIGDKRLEHVVSEGQDMRAITQALLELIRTVPGMKAELLLFGGIELSPCYDNVTTGIELLEGMRNPTQRTPPRPPYPIPRNPVTRGTRRR